ncbi:LLM class F420-dependent oxidoreductase [soil metagenome]
MTTPTGNGATRPFALETAGDVHAGAAEFEALAVRAEADGYDGIGATELQHDPFISVAVAARSTSTIELATSIAVAFARNPMTVAETANDLQLLSNGRFTLGLGSQIKPHIERRFSMPWSHPAERMRDFVLAIRAIQHAWTTREKLDYRGEFYRHTLMTPMFAPDPNPYGVPKIAIAGVGQLMTEVAGEVADGWLSHSFTTPRYLSEVSIPALRRGSERAGRPADAVDVSVAALVAVGSDQSELDAAIRATRKQIAFYGSTPAYASVLELHGWGGLAEPLNARSRRGEWDAMADLVTDDVLAEFASVGSPAEVAAQLRSRYSGLATRLAFAFSSPVAPELGAEIVAALDAS